MHRTKYWRAAALFLGLAVLLLPAGAANAQAPVRIPAEALISQADIDRLLHDGVQLERDGRWGEALGHYEQAIKDYPGQTVFRQRLTLARIHFDVARRYSDASFTQAVAQLSEREALDLYGEVLLKIQSHYVDAPNWQSLVDRGTAHLDIALTEPQFTQQFYSDLSPERLVLVRQELRRTLTPTTVRSRQEARDAVARLAQLAWQRVRLSPQAVILEFTCAATGALDNYSSFLTAQQLDDVFSQIEGNFVGLGIELKSDEQSLLIVNVIPGGPASQAGIRGGDRIMAVDGATMQQITTDEAADMLKGTEGSSVALQVLSAAGTTRQVIVRRQRVEVPSVVDVKIIDSQQGIGYMRITSFQKTTNRDVDNALWQLHRAGMRSLIVDVRGNPGGLLTASVEVADKFVSAGNIVSTRGRSPREDFDYKAHNVGTWRVPLIVLIDHDSASASEIFAGAIHDHRRGTVVGQRSYGKGSVQGIFPLNTSKSGVRLTTAKFYSPNGHPISDRGVTPDVVVRSAAKPPLQSGAVTALADDPVLSAGVQVARQQLSQR